MADYLLMDAAFVEREINSLILAYPELAEDDALRADMIEGETGLTKIVERAFDHRQEAETMVEALKAREMSMSERRSRYARRGAAMDMLIKKLMTLAGVDKLILTEATISITNPRGAVDVTDASALPQGFFSITRTPDKKAIGDRLRAGETIPGAALAYGETGLSVRTK